MRRTTMALAVLLTFAAVACSSDDAGGGGQTAATTDGGEPSGCTDPTESATIQVSDFAFEPSCLTPPAGTDTLSVTNTTNSTTHTFTIAEADLNEDLDPGSDVAVDIAALNDQEWAFRCTIHPQMTGVLVIT